MLAGQKVLSNIILIRTSEKMSSEDSDIRVRSRFFDQVGHQITNASIENKHFFTK